MYLEAVHMKYRRDYSMMCSRVRVGRVPQERSKL